MCEYTFFAGARLEPFWRLQVPRLPQSSSSFTVVQQPTPTSSTVVVRTDNNLGREDVITFQTWCFPVELAEPRSAPWEHAFGP